MTSEVFAKSGNLGKNSVARRKIRFGRYRRHNFTLTETLSDEDSVSLSSVASLNSEESAESENPRPENIFNGRSLGTFLSDSIPLNKKSSSNVGVKCDQSVSRSDSSEASPVKKSASASSVQQKNSLNFKIHQVYKSRACPLTDEETVSLSSAESSAYSCRVSDFGDSSRTQLRSLCKNSALETARAGLTKCNLGFRGQAYARGKLKDDTEDDSVSFSSADSDRRESGLYRDLRSRALRSIAKSGKRDETRSNVSFERFHRLTDEETVSLSSLENNASVSASSSVSSGGADRYRVSRHFFERNKDEALQVANTATSEDENCESGAVEINESFVQIPLEGEERSEEFEYGSDLSDKDDFDPKKPSFCFIRGSDPRIATCRGKLQNKRSKLNQEINKELRLRAGAENLFKATTNRKLRETVALELSFVNSNLQLLKEQLAELNSSVEIYQGDSPEPVMPMIPLGLKETKEIDFREPFKDFILEHYSEDGSTYEIAIAEFMEMRQAMRTPNRDNSGIALLFQYYNQLYFVERRFFPPDRSLGIYFEWYDSLTGVPSCQKTVAFEKACVLFNMAAVYTQMGAKQDRLTEKGLDQAVDSFLRAAGTYTYIQENFTNAPSMDLAPQMLDMLVHLMLAQARECLFEKLELQSEEKRNVDVWLDLAQESAQLAQVYETVHSLITMASVREYVPYSWVSLVQVKHQHYAGLAHFHGAIALLSKSLAQLSERSKDMLHYLHVEPDYKTPSHIQLDTDEQRKQLGKAHLKSALQMHEESQRLQRMCRELRSKKALSRVLARTFDDVAETLADTDEDDAFSEILEAPCIQPSTKFQLSLTPPDFAHLPVEDLFKQLGPVAIFSAKHHWTAPRSVRLQRGSSHDVGFGFSVRGDSPVIVAAVDQGSLAHFGGMKEGDFIVAIGNCDVKWSQHDHVVKLIKEAGDSLSLKLVTPMDRNYLKPKTKSNQSEIGSGTGTNSSSNSGTGTQGNSPNGSVNTHKKLTWNPFKKHRERETSFNIISR